jgi:site-specific recombinase XerC
LTPTNNELQQIEDDPLSMFMYGLRAKESRRQYPKRLKVFMDYCSLDGCIEHQAKELFLRAKDNNIWLQSMLIKFIEVQKQRVKQGEILESTIRNYYKATKLFCEMNDIVLNWKKITKGLPRGREAANDRAPTIEEIQKLVEYPDRRIKAIVYTMISSGIRLGSFDFLKWKHIIPMYNEYGELGASKVIVYAGDNEEYYSFITPEAYMSLKDWMDFRASYGENITGESWLMRDLWQTTNTDSRYRNGLATYPNKLKSSGIKRLIERALWDQGLRRPLKDGQKRHEWKAAHGFRKFFTTQLIQSKVNPEIREMLLGHKIGLASCYYRPTEREMYAEYEKAIDNLTIDPANRLQRKVTELQIKQDRMDRVLSRIDVLEKELGIGQ